MSASQAPSRRRAPRLWAGELAAAAAQLTVGPSTPPPAVARTSRPAGWYGVVGGLIGLVSGGVLYLATPRLGSGVAAVIGVLVLAGACRARPVGGLARVVDARLGTAGAAGGTGATGEAGVGGRSRGRSAVGPEGVLTIVLYALLLAAVLSETSRRSALETLIAAGALSRAAALGPALARRPADRSAVPVTSPAAAAVAALGAVVVAYAALGPARASAAMVAAASASVVGTLTARGRADGAGGDVEATIALAELAVCLAVLAATR